MTTDVATSTDEVVDDLDEEDLLLARIPLLAGSENKSKYLSLRAVGFGVTASAQMVGVTRLTVSGWRKRDKVFRDIEENRLVELQRTAGPDVLRMNFTRNLYMFLEKDRAIMAKSMKPFDAARQQYTDSESLVTVDGIEGMTDREWEYFKTIRKNYTAAELLSLMKALEPERHHDKIIILNWQGTDRPAITIETVENPATIEEGALVNTDA